VLEDFQTVSPCSTLANFSHLGVRQRASVKGSTNACETFCGSVQAGDPQKVSLVPKSGSCLRGGGGGGGGGGE